MYFVSGWCWFAGESLFDFLFQTRLVAQDIVLVISGELDLLLLPRTGGPVLKSNVPLALSPEAQLNRVLGIYDRRCSAAEVLTEPCRRRVCRLVWFAVGVQARPGGGDLCLAVNRGFE